MIVVGGGVMGMATACALAGRGADVTVLERYTVGHQWASSHGLTRALRHEYGPKAVYTRMVAGSLPLWDDLERETGRRLYTETGVLTLGKDDDGETLAGLEVMRGESLPVERLSPAECARRFPQFQAQEYSAITWNPRGGMLHASDCLLAFQQRLAVRGGRLREGAQVAGIEPTATGARVRMVEGDALEADRVIVTVGPWAPEVLAGLALTPVHATRQQVCYFAGADAEMFAVGAFPVFLAEMECYGFPLQGPGWLKIASHVVGPVVNPNEGYKEQKMEVAFVRDFLRRVIPSAAALELTLVDRCMYDMTPDEDFILDRVPGAEGVIVGTGFSGHGFKFAPLIGELLASLALDQQPAFPLDTFRLNRFGPATYAAPARQ
jgi:sarcosine oxidase